MSEGKFYTAEEIRPLYDEIIPVYQNAFAGDPWYEKSKCADDLQRCVGGFSDVEIGAMCGTCAQCPTKPAYEYEELVDKFYAIGSTRPTSWYVENFEDNAQVVALAWTGGSDTVTAERYADIPDMKNWLQENVDFVRTAWLDEIFADQARRPNGNLKYFELICRGLMRRLGADSLAFRTVNERLVAAAKRDFGQQTDVFPREKQVPDRRDFVVIRGTEQ